MIFGALVILLIVLSLAFLIIPVLRKPSTQDSVAREEQNITIAKEKKVLLEEQLAEGQLSQQEFDNGMKDLETSLALDLERQQTLGSNLESGKWAIWFFIAFVPVLSIFMYYQLGEYRVIEDPSLALPRNQQAQAPHGSGGGKAPTMSEMMEKLKGHLRENPDDFRGWLMMGRTQMSMQQFPQAVTALQRALDLNDTDSSVMLMLADALAMSNGGDMSGEPEALVLQALELSPNALTGLWLAGLAAEQGGRFREAHDYFTRVLPMVSDDPASTAEIKTRLAELRQQQPDLPEVSTVTAGSSTPLIKVSVMLDSNLASKASPGDLLFIYAKAASGPPMPLAARRMQVSDLPLQLTLSDSDAMMPQMKLSGFDQVIVGARISKSGNPISQPGDLFDESEVFGWKTYNGVVNINIDQVK